MTYRILITGSRDWPDDHTVEHAILVAARQARDRTNEQDFVVVHGDCPRGADAYADRFMSDPGFAVERHPAQWMVHEGCWCQDKSGRCRFAGLRRNQEMVDLGADVCLAFLLPQSRGTVDCVQRADRAGIPVVEYGKRA